MFLRSSIHSYSPLKIGDGKFFFSKKKKFVTSIVIKFKIKNITKIGRKHFRPHLVVV